MKRKYCRLAIAMAAGIAATAFASARSLAQAPQAKPKAKKGEKAVRKVTFSNLTLAAANEKVREMQKPDEPRNKFYLKSVGVTVGRLGVRYKLTFQTFLPRTRHAFAVSRAALDAAFASAREHGGTIITDLQAYNHNRRLYFAYVSRIVAPRGSRLNFRVMADLPDAIFKETIDIQKKFGRRLVRTSKYTDRHDRTYHAMLFVGRNVEINRPNFRYKSSE